MNNNLSHIYKNRLKELAGISIISENVVLKANNGRSDSGTLSWYAEEYLLNLASQIITSLDEEFKKENLFKLSISQSSSIMASNSLVTKLTAIKNNDNKIKEDFTFSLTVNFTKNASTEASITTKGITNHLTLNSTHSADDISNFIQNILEYFLNSTKTNQD